LVSGVVPRKHGKVEAGKKEPEKDPQRIKKDYGKKNSFSALWAIRLRQTDEPHPAGRPGFHKGGEEDAIPSLLRMLDFTC